MPINKPYHRTFRQFIEAPNAGYSSSTFMLDREYAIAPQHYVRAFLIIQEDIKDLFEYIEPADSNLTTFSFKINELLIRTCTEFEANCKAILRENIFTPTYSSGPNAGTARPESKWNINDYKKINKTHNLRSYYVTFPFWRGTASRFCPFYNWDSINLDWYQAYNSTKHDRPGNFESANLKNLLNAFAGLFVILSAQFKETSFQPRPALLAFHSGGVGIGDYLKIEFPTNWPEEEKYDFDWMTLKEDEDRFQKIDYNVL